MAQKGLFSDLQGAYRSMYDSNGIERVIPLGNYSAMEPKRADLLRKLLQLLQNTDVLRVYSKAYIFGGEISMKEAYEKVAEKQGEEATVAGLKKARELSKYDRDKLNSALGKEFVQELAFRKVRFETLEKKVKELHIEHYSGYNKLKNNCVLSLPAAPIVQNISDSDFDGFLHAIQTYSRTAIKGVEDCITEEMLGYLTFILNRPLENPKDIKNRDDIVAALTVGTGDGDNTGESKGDEESEAQGMETVEELNITHEMGEISETNKAYTEIDKVKTTETSEGAKKKRRKIDKNKVVTNNDDVSEGLQGMPIMDILD